jgi:ABC-type transport system substrate-binding protein
MQVRKIAVSLTLLGILLFSLPGIAVSHAQVAGSNLTIGTIQPLSPTFFECPTCGLIGGAAAELPYMFPWDLGINGAIVPALTHAPQAVAGTNDTQWIINLYPNLKWSDGVAMNSTDLAYSYGIYLSTGPYANLSTIDTYGAIAGTVSSVTIMNSTAVKLQMVSPDPLFPYLAFLYYIYPAHYYAQFKGNNVLGTTSITGGPGDAPYIPQGYTATSYTLTAVRNAYYYNWTDSNDGPSTVTIQFFTSSNARDAALAAGTVDAADVSSTDIPAITSNPGLTIDNVPSTYQMFIYVNSTGQPWNQISFRQALAYLVPKQMIDTELYNGSALIGTPEAFTAGMNATYGTSGVPQYTYNPTAAAQLLQKAGLSKNSQGEWAFQNGTAVSITITAENDDPNFVRAAQFYQTAMQNVGLQVKLNLVPTTTCENDFSTFNYQILMFENGYAPTPYRYDRAPINTADIIKTNSTFANEVHLATTDTNPTTSLKEIALATKMLAQNAVVNPVVVLPGYVAYGAKFTNWDQALAIAPLYNTFATHAVMTVARNVLASVEVAGATSTASTTSTSTASTTSTSTASTSASTASTSTSTASTSTNSASTTSVASTSSSSSSSSSTSYGVSGAIALIVPVIIVGVAAYWTKRRSNTPTITFPAES